MGTTPFQIVMTPVRNEAWVLHAFLKATSLWTDEFQLFESGEYKLGFAEVKKRIRRTPFLPIGYWKKVIKYWGNYIGLWKR